ncbi:EamA family transporter [Arsenicicoccus dermatophilus]|uniref:EamA family transporter n=1 Tax=Arsenicicoccus dermatophilus TaxID=1076331 RepID=UPI001F4C5EF3|nr:DMT family transporter [Arsenicicoccus dermatophilus]MCH8611597.1 DMT family transporter [Arsenicicoccus dermatophilus]
MSPVRTDATSVRTPSAPAEAFLAPAPSGQGDVDLREVEVYPLPHVDDTEATGRAGSRTGLVLALISAAAFATSGSFAKALLGSGWTPGAAVTARIAGAALALAIPALWVLRGDLRPFLRHWKVVLGYGAVAVAGSQLFYFNAVTHLSVGVALLLEYLAPVLIVGYVWARSRTMPSPATLAGATFSMLGLALVIDLFGGIGIDPVGLAWGLAAACCNAAYFLLAARDTEGLPPIALAAGGMTVGGLVLGLAGLLGLVPMAASMADAVLAGHAVPWWAAVAGVALIAAAVAYGFGVAATRRLGSTVASFVGLTEVVFAIAFAWLLLGELPGPMQLAGGALILAGVATVKIGESRA